MEEPKLKKRKLIIDARESGTSTGRYIDNLIKYLHKLDHGYDVTLLAKAHRLEFLAGIAPDFTVIECPYKEFSLYEQTGLKRMIQSLAPDLVHFPAVQQPVRYRGRVVTTMQDLTTLRFRNPAKNPIIFTIKQRVYHWVNMKVAHKSVLLITPSEFVKQDVAAFASINPDKITVTYEAADDLPTPAEPIPGLEDKRFIMYLGRPTPHKNLPRLIEAFAKLQKQNPDLYLVLAGKKDANYQQIEADAQKQGITNIIFTDFISDQQLRWTYEHCQAYVFPSLSEGFGLPGLEAMQHGAPVVSGSATCLPEIYGDAALYFDPLDVDDITAKINTMISDPKLREDYINRGFAQAKKYSWQRMAEQTLAVYNKVLAD